MVESTQADQSSRFKGALSPIDRFLKKNKVLGNPFVEFYFIMMHVMIGSQTTAQQQNINKFATQLKSMNGYLADFEAMKSDFYNASTQSDSSQFTSDTSKLMNAIFGKWLKGQNLSPFGSVYQNYVNLKAIKQDIVNAEPTSLDKDFPTLGEKNVQSLLKSILPMEPFFSSSIPGRAGPGSTFHSEWVIAQGVDNNGKDFLPEPSVIQSYVDDFSQGSGMLSGVGGVESSTLQMKQQSFNRLQSFIKNMLSDWLQARKSFNSSMSQANN